MSDELIIGIIAALSGFVVALVTALLNRSTQKELTERNAESQKMLIEMADRLSSESQHQQRVFESLEWFERGTRKRSLGLAVISSNWEKMPEMHQLWKNILIIQAVYLLSEAKRKREGHEAANLNSILTLLKKTSLDELEKQSIQQALISRKDNSTKGMELIQSEENAWKTFADV